MRTHPGRLTEAGITPWRYAELRAICRQYREHRRTIERVRAGIVDRPRRRGGPWHLPDPTGSAAINLASLPCQRIVRAIEQSAAAVAEPVVAAAILKSVTEGTDYEHMRPPCGQRQFYVLRQLFFIELDRKLMDG